MRLLFQHRGLRLIFIANLVSMIGSGMNTAAVTWFILQATHSEMSLSALVAIQTVPAGALPRFDKNSANLCSPLLGRIGE